MIKRIFLGACLLAATAAVPAADTFDLKAMSCQELLASSEEDLGYLLFWIDGYLSGVTGDTKFNGKNLEDFSKNMGEACAKSPDAKVLDTAKIVGIQ